MNKRFRNLLITILAASLPFLVILGALDFFAFNSSFYEKEFAEYNPDVENKMEITSDLIFFLKNKNAGMSNIASFAEVEQEHLVEVRQVLHLFLSLLNSAIISSLIAIALLIYFDKKEFLKNLGISFFYGGIATIATIALFLIITLNFSQSFANFHYVLFTTQWQFPADYLLIRLFPKKFFIDILSAIMVRSFIAGILVSIFGYFIKKEKQ